MVYKLELPPSLVGVHDIFHMSQLKKWLKAPMYIVLPEGSGHKAQDRLVLQGTIE
jgi:hypothetical protein